MKKKPDWGVDSLRDEVWQVLDERVIINKDEKGRIAEKRVLPVAFVPLVGSQED